MMYLNLECGASISPEIQYEECILPLSLNCVRHQVHLPPPHYMGWLQGEQLPYPALLEQNIQMQMFALYSIVWLY